ncbi:MAG: aspartate-semialdehyde dehydrogenase [Ruminococcaceae bacterium]|nr:aspartate-semialdehyde dehydrogenase [Oscillospiraceae bacterium]
MAKLRAGIVGATGMVGQRFITLIENHPYFEITALAASPSSAGKAYGEAVKGRWMMKTPLSENIANMTVFNAEDIESIKPHVDFVFCAVNLSKDATREMEEAYAKAEIPVVSNNSAHRGTPDVPMLIPEINFAHTAVIESQKKRLGTKKGFISVKPNCSIQSYVPALEPLRKYGIKEVNVTTFQAISGAGKTFETWPEILDNVIPYIGGEEEKSEKEPLKVWGKVEGDVIVNATSPVISAQCIRVPASDGHLAAVSVKFENKPSIEEIKAAWAEYIGEAQRLELPHAPEKFLTYFEEENRPQTGLDRDLYGGMGISIGRLREDSIFDYKFICLSHNTLRGAAGGAVLGAELLYKQGYLY